jgi:hypothetical protein
MKNSLTSLLLVICLMLPGTLFSQAAQDVTIRQLNTYENLTEPGQINAHPLAGVLVKFTGVIVSYPRNSGLAGYTAATNSINRIHMFMVDTNAVRTGLDGQYMQVVDAANMELLEQLNRGDVVTVEGRLTFFAAGTGFTSQMTTTTVTLVGNVNEDVPLQKYKPLLEPTVVTLDEINLKLPDGTFSHRLDNYTKYINRYVKVVGTTVVNSLQAPTGRPWMYVGNENVILPTTDTSLRFRNDRSATGYRTGYNFIRPSESPFSPPPPGALVDISGFIVMNSFNVDNTGANTYKIVPWDDGVVWVSDGQENPTFIRTTPAGWPNDLVVVGFPPAFTNFTISTQTPTSTQQVSISVDITAPNEGVTVTSANLVYRPRGGAEVSVALVKGAGNTYTYTFPTFADLTSVSFAIEATDSKGLKGRFTALNTNFIVLNNPITAIKGIQQTADGTRGPSPLGGIGVLPMNIVATVVSDSSDGFVVIQDSNLPWSGIPLVNTPATRKLRRGDVITITSAEVLRQFDMNYLSNLTFTKSATSNTNIDAITPLLTTGIFGLGNRGAEYIGMLIRFQNVSVASTNADFPSNFGEWSFASPDQTPVRVDDRFQFNTMEILSNFTPTFNRHLVPGAQFTSLRGVLQWSFGNPKFAIRKLNDIVPVRNITTPNRNFALLSPADNANVDVAGDVKVSWDAVSTDFDGDAVQYIFVLANKPAVGEPDFKNPLTIRLSDVNGTTGDMTLSTATLNALLQQLGVAVNETRAFAWTVWVTDSKDTVQVSTYANATGHTPIYRTVNLKKLTTTSVEDENLPKEFSLSQNYPNPFNPTTAISYSLPQDVNVKLTVYDMLGREVAVLVNELKSAGTYTVSLEGQALASGIYLYRLEAGNRTFTRKMTLLK